MAKFNFEKINFSKIKNIISVIAVVVAVALVSPGVLDLVNSQGEIITDEDIAAYNSTKYQEEETQFANNNGNDVFLGFAEIPEITPDPKSKANEKNNLSEKMKDIMKDKDAVAPKTTTKKNNNNKVTTVKTKATATPKPTATVQPTATPLPTIEPIPLPTVDPNATPVPEDILHIHRDNVDRYNIYAIKTVVEGNVLAVGAVPHGPFKGKIDTVEISLLYNDQEVARRTVTDVSNILEVFGINAEENGCYEVELYITFTDEINAPTEPVPTPEPTEVPAVTPVPTEAPADMPKPTAEPANIEGVYRQMSAVVYIIADENAGEVVENPMVEEPTATADPSVALDPTATADPMAVPDTEQGEEEPINTEMPEATPVLAEASVLTEDKKLEEPVSEVPVEETALTE